MIEGLAALTTKQPSGPPDSDDPEAVLAALASGQLAGPIAGLQALLMLADGDLLDGLAALADAAEEQLESWSDDPPRVDLVLFTRLGEEYLELGAPRLAVHCFERTLEVVRNDGFALAGLVVAHHESGDDDAARAALARLNAVWRDADRPNRWLDAARATGLAAEPDLGADIVERSYREHSLDRLGPSVWTPAVAPELEALDAEGQPVRLADLFGQNVVLVFYLGEECAHCMEQLQALEARREELAERNAVVVAVSRDDVETLVAQQEGLGITLL